MVFLKYDLSEEFGVPGLSGLIIDGYIEKDAEFYRNLPRQEWVKNNEFPRDFYMPIISRHLSPSKEHDDLDIRKAFMKFAKGLSVGYKKCPYRNFKFGRRGEDFYLSQYERPTCKISSPTLRYLVTRKAAERFFSEIPSYSEEEERKVSNQRGLYQPIFVIHVDSPHCNSEKLLECCNNWINKLNFKIKEKNEYEDFQKFKEHMEYKLKDYADHFCLDRKHLLFYLALS